MELNSISYTKHIWEKGEVITKEKLNHIETDGLEYIINQYNNGMTAVQNYVNGLDYTSTGGVLKTPTSISETDGLISVTYEDIQTATTAQKGVTTLSNTQGSAENVAATPKGVQNAIAQLDVSDAEKTGEFVSQVSETDGKISVSRTALNPSITIGAGTASDTPTVNVTVNTKSGTAQSITKASTSVFGATKLTSSQSTTEEGLAATPKGVWDAINQLDVSEITCTTAQTFTSISETDGKISASPSNIQIAESQVTDLNTHLNLKAPLASPALTGTPTAPTAAVGTNSTQIATTAFVASEIASKLSAADAMMFKGVVNSNTNLPATHEAGWTYKIGTAGTYAGNTCEVGDLIICITDGTTTNNAHWAIVQNNVDGSLFKSNNSFVDGNILIADGTVGKVKDSGLTIATSVPANAEFLSSSSFDTGDTNGTFKVTTIGNTAKSVAIKGLGSAAYTESSAYATAGHNHDTAYASLNHTHTADDITDLATVLIENFGLTLALPTSAVIGLDGNDKLEVTYDKYTDSMSFILKESEDGIEWNDFDQTTDERQPGYKYKAICTRTFLGTSSTLPDSADLIYEEPELGE